MITVKFKKAPGATAKDPFGIEKSINERVEKDITKMVKDRLKPFESELGPYNVQIDLTRTKSKINVSVTSDAMPDDLRERVLQALNEA